MKKRKLAKRLLIGTLCLGILFFGADLLFPVPAEIEYAPIVEAQDGKVLHAYLTKDEQWRMKTRLDEITPELRKAIIYKEDKYFYYHPGVNMLAIGRAVVNNIVHSRRTSGASTITMQVARMLEPKRRTYINKLAEIFRALQLEIHFTKDEILQLYLNLVPYGSNIQGVKAASILYFNKMPDQLSLAEITALSIIPNRPNSLMMGKDNKDIVKRRNKWLLRFKQNSLFPSEQINDALAEPLTAYRHNAPDKVPQLAYRVGRMQPRNPEIRTTIDAAIQQKAEDLVINYMNGLKLNNIYNASVIIVDNATREVRAYIGSSDFEDRLHNGQVDGVSAMRSPGSTLKPLLYGLCIDKGLVTPKSVIADVPINISGYIPENYDLQFRGNVTIEEALKQSLNIPAVKMLNEAGVQNFANVLKLAGFFSIARLKNKIGLSLILGGCTVRLDELTGLYASFANDGYYYPLQYITPDTVWIRHKKQAGIDQKETVSVVSPISAFMISQIISGLHRPDLPNLPDKSIDIPRIAWKTGTSYGRKDAWSIGYNKNYTVGVWIGNFNGDGVAGLNGAGVATPLLFQIFRSVDRRASEEWLQAPAEAGLRAVCRQTGKLPADFCDDVVMDYYIPGVSSSEHCDHIRRVWLSADEKFCYCTSCLPQAGYKTKSFVNVSPELAAFYETGHIPYGKIPPHNPNCSRIFEGKAPIITSLTNQLTYLIVDKGEQKLQLACNTANDVRQVYWYINDNFFGTAKPNEKLFFMPANNNVKISCTDDKGRNADINIKVKYL
jgi:penicillin-binding protein 1C